MLLIVDDEVRQRRFLVKTIQELYPQKSVMEAKDGREALQKVEKYPITSIITDIRMPMVDGLTFVEDCRRVRKDIMIIFLTAYANFEYAQKAIQVGAVDYIVKPLNKAKLKEMVDKLEELEREQIRKKEERERIRQQLETALPVYKQVIWQDFIKGKGAPENLQKMLKAMGEGAYPVVLALSAAEEGGDVSDGMWRESVNRMRRCLEDASVPTGNCIFFPVEKDGKLFAAILLNSIPVECSEKEFIQKVRRILNRANQDSGFIWSAAGTDCAEFSAEHIPRAYCMSRRKLDAVFFHGAGDYYYDLPSGDSGRSDYENANEKQLAEAVFSGDSERARQILRSIMEAAEKARYSPEQYKFHIWYVVSYVYKQNRGHFSESSPNESIDSDKEKILSCATKAQVRAAADGILNKMIHNVENCRSENAEPLMLSRRYINEHYMDDLSRDVIAVRFHISPSYFSVMFKQMFGKTFSEYLTEVRMEHAAELLERGTDNIVTVARKTGYRDVKYFLRVFKKYFDCTPNDYRHRGRKNENMV